MPLVSQTFNQLLDFTRTSAATFVGSNGLIQNTPASVNLLTQTQQFDNAAWSKTGTTATANTTVAPDGTSTADTLTAAATSGTHLTNQSLNTTATATTFSVYAKQNGYNWLGLGITDSGGVVRVSYFNLTDGTVGTVASGITASIVNAGNGWYRCIITVAVAQTGTNTSRIYVTNADNVTSYTGDGTSGIFVWGAQTEAAATASTYTRNNGGVFPPRFDYDPVTLAPKGLLVEEQRVNLVTYSEQFDNVVWATVTLTIAANTTVSPDGTSNADTATRTSTANTENNIRFTTTQAVSTAHTFSLYVKANTANARLYMRNLAVDNTATTGVVQFNPADGTVSTTYGSTYVGKATMTAVGNGWYRCSITGTTPASIATNFIDIGVTDGTSAVGGNAANSIFIYGAQLEAGAFATSYIPTVASQVTRTADQTSIVAPNFAPWFNPSEGTFVAEFDVLSVANTKQNNIVALYTTGTNDMRIWMWEGAPTIVRWSATNGTTQADINSSAVTANTVIKSAAAYKSNDFAASFNGAATVTDTSATVPTGFSLLDIGTYTGPTGTMCGHIRSIRYYPTRLTNAQLQALTA